MEMQSRYTPPTSFRESSIEAVADFLAKRVLCTVIAMTPSGLHGSHLPVALKRHADGRYFLEGHVARENLRWRLLDAHRHPRQTRVPLTKPVQAGLLPEVYDEAA